ncbi:hypothetical protein J6590_066524 [Homalodisca vitripennis]|nr:hypothetical protein J6590_066524 [Homalodisca vitripennis]
MILTHPSREPPLKTNQTCVLGTTTPETVPGRRHLMSSDGMIDMCPETIAYVMQTSYPTQDSYIEIMNCFSTLERHSIPGILHVLHITLCHVYGKLNWVYYVVVDARAERTMPITLTIATFMTVYTVQTAGDDSIRPLHYSLSCLRECKIRACGDGYGLQTMPITLTIVTVMTVDTVQTAGDDSTRPLHYPLSCLRECKIRACGDGYGLQTMPITLTIVTVMTVDTVQTVGDDSTRPLHYPLSCLR